MAGLGITTMVVLAAAGIFSAIAFRALLRRQSDPFLRRVIVIGLVAKLLGTAAYYRVIADVYGSGDVTQYVRVGRGLAPIIRGGTLPEKARETGTPFMEFLAGVVFAIFGSSEIVAYVVFSMLSFIGMLLFVFAYRLAVPDGDHRRYAVLVLLMPTMLFWPSTIGKEAWLVFTLGAASYGAARVMAREPFGYLLVAVSVAGMGAVRPHMGALFATAFAAAFLLRLRDPQRRGGLAGWMLGLVIIGAGTGYALLNFSAEMGRGEVAEEATLGERVRADTDEIFDRTDRMTRQGGGEFESRPVRNPIDLVHAFFTVPFRPFPFEAHNYQSQLSSLEGLLLLGLFIAALPRLAMLPRRMLRSPYLAFAAIYATGFIVAFSNIANFGIITRQRAQLLPLLMVLMALPKAKQSVTGRLSPRPGASRAPVLLYPEPESDETPDTAAAERSGNTLPGPAADADPR